MVSVVEMMTLLEECITEEHLSVVVFFVGKSTEYEGGL
jgi:hypothetical protein